MTKTERNRFFKRLRTASKKYVVSIMEDYILQELPENHEKNKMQLLRRK